MTDRATAYAEQVRAGTVVVGRLQRQACLRHLRDQQLAAERGWEWRSPDAEEAIDFFDQVLCLPEEADADEEPDEEAPPDGQPFVLTPWQQFVVGSLMGWYTVRNGRARRRFRTAYIETAKGSGKTPLCAGLLIYLAVTGDRGSQIFAAAATKDQAKVAFADCEKMVAASPYLRDLFVGTVNNLAIPSKESFIRAISSEKRGLDGKRVSAAVLDELHEHPTATVVNKIRKGIKGRKNALILEPTNAGFDRTSVCWAHHEYSRKVLDGTIEAEDWFAFICGLDPCDDCMASGRWFPDDDCAKCDDWKTEGPHWLKANPNLGVSLPWQYVRDLVRQAKGMPTDVSDLLRFTFGIWTRGANRAVDMGKWAACQPMPSQADLDAAECFGCLDMGQTDDFTAFGRLWVLADGRVAVQMRYWLPSDALDNYPNRPYDQWRRAKILTVHADSEVTDFAKVRADILDDCRAYGIRTVFYDPNSARETSQELTGEGVDMAPMSQGFKQTEAIKRWQALIVTGQLCHGNDPILAWMASNTVVIDGPKGEKRLAKELSPEKIDGIAALVMGIEGAVVRRERAHVTEPQVFFVGGAKA
jgi:phage terminase large subunit-like protein